MEELFDALFAVVLVAGSEFAEEAGDVGGFEMDAGDFVVGAAALDDRPVDDVVGGDAEGVAHVGLLKDFLLAGAVTAVGEELVGREFSAVHAVDDFDEAILNGVGHANFEVDVPGWSAGASFLGEFVEESVLTVVGGPDGEIMAECGAALGGFPKEFGVGMFGEFVEADVAAVNGHGLWVGGESENARAVVEFDDTDLDVFDDAGGAAGVIEALEGEVFLISGEDGAGEVEDFGELVALLEVFKGAGIIFGGEEVIAFFEPEPFANVFEAVGEGPADANGFFGEGDGLFALIVDGLFGLYPFDLVRHEVAAKGGVGVEFASAEEVHRNL